MNPTLRALAALSLLAVTPGLALAQNNAAPAEHDHMAASAETTLGDLTISGAFARATLPGAPVGGAYLTITNKGSAPDRLVAVASPAAKGVEMHDMQVEDDIMKMLPLPDGVEIPAGGSVTLEPNGKHLMLQGLAGPLKEGQSVALTLTFEKAGTVEVSVPIAGIRASEAPMAGMAM